MYQVIIIDGQQQEAVGHHATLAEATEAMWRCMAVVRQYHFAILRPDGALNLLAAARRGVAP